MQKKKENAAFKVGRKARSLDGTLLCDGDKETGSHDYTANQRRIDDDDDDDDVAASHRFQ